MIKSGKQTVGDVFGEPKKRPKNMMNSAHKATNKAYRDRYDEIRWDEDKDEG